MVIVTVGFNVTIARSLVLDMTGAMAGLDGGLTKIGAGTLIPDAANYLHGSYGRPRGHVGRGVNGGLGAGNTTLDNGVILTSDAGVIAAHAPGTGTTLTLVTANTSIANLEGTGVQDTVTALIALQFGVNAALRGFLDGNAFFATLVSYAVGTLVSLGCLLLLRPALPSWSRVAAVS